jgi:hypothetical protein
MTIIVEVSGASEQMLHELAAQSGLTVAEYIQALVDAGPGTSAGTAPGTSPQRVIVSGLLDELNASRRTFRLRMASGQSLRGILPTGDPAAYAGLFTRKVTVDGWAVFASLEAPPIIHAAKLREASDRDVVWEQVPRPRPRLGEALAPRDEPPPGSNGSHFVPGQWPGDETDEELLAALKAMD